MFAQERHDQGGRALGIIDEWPVPAAVEELYVDIAEEFPLLLRVSRRQERVARAPR